MRKILGFGVFLFVLFQYCHGDYIGAVVEYNPLNYTSPNLTIEENIKIYIYQIEKAKGLGVQIIVFPEYGLTGLVTNPENFSLDIPSIGTGVDNILNYFLLRLASAAKEYQIYVVANVLEKALNSENRTIYYNTNVVFSNNGTLIARYRKINLYNEPNLIPGDELVTFTTDFGTFGLMTCMDILYQHPAQTLLANSTVTDVLYPAAWNSYLPFYMSLEVQVGYAASNKVNLLAANINDPTNGRGGSGIYGKDGTILRRILTDSPSTNLAVANIESNVQNKDFSTFGFDIFKNESLPDLSNYKTLKDFDYNSYVYKPLNLSQENITEEICDGSFCCNFNVVAWQNETNLTEVYKLVAYNGQTYFGSEPVHISFCNLVACTTDDVSTCGDRPAAPLITKFRRIVVWGNFENRPDQFYRVTSLRGNLLPLFNVTYLESRGNESLGISLNTTQVVDNVVLFGVYAKGGATSFSVSLVFVAVLVVLQCIF